MKRKRLLTVTLILALVGATTAAALAQPYRYRGGPGYSQYHGGYGHYRGYRNDNGAAAAALGILAFGTIAALAANNNRYYGGYGGGYYDYGYYGRGYSPYAYRYDYPRSRPWRGYYRYRAYGY